jgi:hypothetical protein
VVVVEAKASTAQPGLTRPELALASEVRLTLARELHLEKESAAGAAAA